MFLAHGNGPNIPHRLDTEASTLLGRVEQGFGAVGSLTVAQVKTLLQVLTSAQVKTELGLPTIGTVNVVDGTTLVFDASLGNDFRVTIGGTRNIPTPINLITGVFYLTITQDATGGRQIFWSGNYRWTGGAPVAIRTGAGQSTRYMFISDGTSMYHITNDVVTSPAVFWDEATKPGGTTISNSGYTCTNSGGANNCTKSNVAHASGKYYTEFRLDTVSASGAASFAGVGFIIQSASSGALIAGANAICVRGSGVIFTNSVAGVDLGSPANNDVMRAAIDVGTGDTWFALNTGTWNLSGTADPATAVGGVNIHGGGGQTLCLCNDTRNNSVFTMKPLPTQWTYTAPSGFIQW